MKHTLLLFCCMTHSVFAQQIVVSPQTFVGITITQNLDTVHNLGVIDLRDSASISISGVVTGNGTWRVDSTVTITQLSTSVATMRFDSIRNTIYRLRIFGSMILASTLQITASHSGGSVYLHHGTLVSDSFLVLCSRSEGTARIDSSDGYIYGPVIIERYIPAKRAWRFLGTPFLKSFQSINQAWQEGYTNTSLVCPAQFPGISGFGTQITYRGENGYDVNTTQNPSIFSLVQNSWVAPYSLLTTNIAQYPAYAIFVRGDRTICLSQRTNALPIPTVLRSSGRVYIGDVVRTPQTVAGEYLLEGNPYASSIDVLSVIRRSTGIIPETFFIWDPGYGINGGYVLYSYDITTPLTYNYPNAESVTFLQSSQGYIVQAIQTNPILLYTEKDKKTIDRSSVFARPQREGVVRATLESADTQILDGVVFRLVTGDTAYRSVEKLWNFSGESISTQKNNRNYSIETRYKKISDTCFLSLKRMQQKAYQLSIINSVKDITLVLVDKKEGKTFSIIDSFRYHFVYQDSLDIARFQLVYKQKQDTFSSKRLILSNPSQGTLLLNPIYSGPFCIINMYGQTLYTTKRHRISCQSLSPGVYVIWSPIKKELFIK